MAHGCEKFPIWFSRKWLDYLLTIKYRGGAITWRLYDVYTVIQQVKVNVYYIITGNGRLLSFHSHFQDEKG